MRVFQFTLNIDDTNHSGIMGVAQDLMMLPGGVTFDIAVTMTLHSLEGPCSPAQVEVVTLFGASSATPPISDGGQARTILGSSQIEIIEFPITTFPIVGMVDTISDSTTKTVSALGQMLQVKPQVLSGVLDAPSFNMSVRVTATEVDQSNN
jgi:hypothetical protein